MTDDTFVKSQELAEGVDPFAMEAEDDYPRAGDLVLEQGEYACADCGYIEYFSAGEEFPECDCLGEKGWIVSENEAESTS